MSTINYCLDTNVVSDIMRDQKSVTRKMAEALLSGSNLYISSIVCYEIIRGLQATEHDRRLKKFLDIYSNLPHLYFDRYDMRAIIKAAEIYEQVRHGNIIEDSDIFIAAIAMVNDCTLVTANEKHFERIEGLRWINWRV